MERDIIHITHTIVEKRSLQSQMDTMHPKLKNPRIIVRLDLHTHFSCTEAVAGVPPERAKNSPAENVFTAHGIHVGAVRKGGGDLVGVGLGSSLYASTGWSCPPAAGGSFHDSHSSPPTFSSTKAEKNPRRIAGLASAMTLRGPR
jgi:hypothetical protein